ncbi:MAG TPA: flagellar basal body P-ring formation chaperone FlgA [Petrotogaceae bacterium]|jgi:flagella basal body P-ring formation protein FlgA|nr:flagellar basal body P-ring formation chaperone FlgA [Petrotogaceae bacterium]HQI78383.1 flagellar basal body P-ring formation chaperone FlgA [Petrotogaceae bacterium]
MKSKTILMLFCFFGFTVFSAVEITVPGTIVSDDQYFTVKDIWPEFPYDRTIAFIGKSGLTYTSEELAKTLYGLMKPYDIKYELEFASKDIKVLYSQYMIKEEQSGIDIKKDILEKMQKVYPEYVFSERVTTRPAVEKVISYEINSYGLLKDLLNVTFTAKMPDGKKTVGTLSVTVEKNVKVLVVLQDIKKNQQIKADLTCESTVNVLKYEFNMITKEDLENFAYTTLRDLKAGEPINNAFVKKIPDLKAGQTVEIVVDYGTVMVRATGRLMKDASYGEVVQIRNTDTGVLLEGLLAPGAKVFINMNGGD